MRCLGVKIKGFSYLFGDNQSVILNSTLPHSILKKRGYALSYHCVCEAVAGNIMNFYKIPSEHNPSDILSKHNGYPQAWSHIKTLIFWRGNTKHIRNNNNKLRDHGE